MGHRAVCCVVIRGALHRRGIMFRIKSFGLAIFGPSGVRLAMISLTPFISPSRFFFSLGLTVGILMAGSAQAAIGPTSTLYLMNYGEFSSGSVMGLDLIQGNTVSSFPTGNALDTA